jgi:peptidoglycan-associated lipoprotein
VPAGFNGEAARRILRWMKYMIIFGALLTGCCHDRNIVELPPVPPAPAARPSLAPVGPKASSMVESEAESGSIAATIRSESAPSVSSIDELLLELADAYFELDHHELADDARAALRSDATILRAIAVQSPETTMTIEGHCDERGSAEYNLALGALRAEAAKRFLIDLGIPDAMLRTITYGKERPQCTTQTEACWQKNRRAHLAGNERE